MSSGAWQQHKYDEVFEHTCAHIRRRRQLDPGFGIEQLEGLLQSEYVSQGNDWDGKGTIQHIVQAATIAAYELVMAEWRRELGAR